MNATRQPRTWPYDLVKGIIALILLGLMLYFRPDMGAMIQQQLGLSFGTVTVLDAPQVASGSPTTTLSGRTNAGAAVDVFAGDAKLGTATSGADGTWSLQVTLPAGTYQLRAQAHDAAGAVLGSPAVLAWSSQQQAAAPSVAQEPVDGTQAATTGSENGSENGSEAGVQEKTDASVDAGATGGTESGTGEAAASAGAVDAVAAIDAGADATGATANSAAAPQASVTAVQVSDDMANLSGAGTPGSTVEVAASAISASSDSAADELVLGSVVVGPDGAWQLAAKVTPGEYQLIVRTLDADGTTVDESAGVPLSVPAADLSGAETAASATRDGTAETTAEDATQGETGTRNAVAAIAALLVSAPVLAGDQATLSGAAAPGATVELVSSDKVLGQAVADANGLWVLAAQLEPGSYALQVRSRDAASEQVNTSRVVSLTVPAGGSSVVATGGTVTATAAAELAAGNVLTAATASTVTTTAGVTQAITTADTGTTTTEAATDSTGITTSAGSTAATTSKEPSTASTAATTSTAETATNSGTAGGSSSSGGKAYVVQSGDTLTSLAQEYLDDQARYPEIVAASNEMSKQDPTFQPIPDSNMIVVGQQIWIPSP